MCTGLPLTVTLTPSLVVPFSRVHYSGGEALGHRDIGDTVVDGGWSPAGTYTLRLIGTVLWI
ncbi:hypothetical protein CBJ32_23095 [Salmonella enterica subsp. enterica serovar Give]|nr:hypothetical protein [Salmonella enterica subsp. enterica serovar Give]